MLDLVHLRSFVALAEEMHFGRAATRLNLTQSPLSRQMQMLEHRLGVALLERTTRAVRLTPAGITFLAEARALLVAAEAAERAARRAAGGEVGTVRIGFTAAAAYDALPRLVSGLRARLPGLETELEECVTSEQMAALAERRLDLGLMRPVSPAMARERGIEMRVVLRESFLLAMPAGHPLAASRRLSLADLDGAPFVTWAAGGGTYFLDLLAGAFRQAGIAPRVTQRVNQTHTMLALVGAGLGLALVPRSARHIRMRGILLRPIAVPASAHPELALAWRRGSGHPALPALQALAADLFGGRRGS